MKKDYSSHSTHAKSSRRGQLIKAIKSKYRMKSYMIEYFTNEELDRSLKSKMRADRYLYSIFLTRTLN